MLFGMKKLLEDVVILRLILIFLLVWYHAFCPFYVWKPIDGYPEVFFYTWCALIFRYVRIQTLVFISGYILGYTAQRKPDTLTAKRCVFKKIKRLILPGIAFSILYYILFYDLSVPWYEIVYSILNGCGHLWFLPMLFWCFVGVYIVEKLKIPSHYVLLLSVIAAFCGEVYLPFRLGRTLSYFLFFYIGYGLQRGKFYFLSYKKKLLPIVICLIGYVLGVFINEKLQMGGKNGLLTDMFSINVFRTITSLFGVMGCYWAVHYFIIGKYLLPVWAVTLSSYCYGVYIFQQFILRGLYYYTGLPQLVGWKLLPWIGILITLLGSLFFTHCMLKSRFGRFLIG